MHTPLARERLEPFIAPEMLGRFSQALASRKLAIVLKSVNPERIMSALGGLAQVDHDLCPPPSRVSLCQSQEYLVRLINSSKASAERI